MTVIYDYFGDGEHCQVCSKIYFPHHSHQNSCSDCEELNFVIPGVTFYCKCGWEVDKDKFELVYTPKGLRRDHRCPECGRKISQVSSRG
jgi:hypothetical protein